MDHITKISIKRHSRGTSPANRENNHLNSVEVGINMPGQRTSAEIVQEARTLLNAGNGGGARLVSTRRPITPREPRRQLYGKLAPPGRPPSAFSLQYLQSESNRLLPSLEPILQQQSLANETPVEISTTPNVRRSGSIGTLLDSVSIGTNNNSTRVQGKLPALLAPPKITASLNNLIEDMPSSNTLNSEIKKLNENGNQMEANENNIKNLIFNNKEEHPLLRRQTKSFDDQQTQNNSRTMKPPLPPTRNIGSKVKGSKNLNVIGEAVVFEPKTEGINKISNNSIKENNNKEKKENFLEVTDLEDDFTVSKAKLPTRTNDLIAKSTTDTLLDLLKAHSGIKDCNEETVQHINAILVELYTRVKGATKGDWRNAILGALYGLVECTSAKVLLSVARVVLALCVTGSNLTGACKLVFKVARNESNDVLFHESDIPELLIDGLGRASPLDDTEACVYGYGAIRFLASDSSVDPPNGKSGRRSSKNILNCENLRISNRNDSSAEQDQNDCNSRKTSSGKMGKKQISISQRLARHGAIQLMVLHLQILNEVGGHQRLVGPPSHVLYQLSAALRSLAGISQNNVTSLNASGKINEQSQEDTCPVIKETNEIQDINLELACPHLVKAAEISIGELEIQGNIIRTMSVLSEHDNCCNVLADYSARIGMLLGPHEKHSNNGNEENAAPDKYLAILSRLGYILGNIMAKFDEARVQFYQNDVAMEYLLDALDIYSKQKFTLHNQMGDTVVDVLIKLVRVIANMSVNSDVGYEFGMKPPLGRILLHLLVIINRTSEIILTCDVEELLHAVLGALHNLCFYQDEFEKPTEELAETNFNSMNNLISELSIALCDTLKSGNESTQPEAARVLGNVTRNPIARESFCKAGGLKTIIKCLKTENYELKSNCSGVLVNLLGDWERRAPFLELQGPYILRDILSKSGQQEDWLLAGIVCQALWNYLIDSGDVIRALGSKEADKISEQLAEYLDEEKLFNGATPDISWEQFATVATDLLERIQSELSNENTPFPSDEEDEDQTDVRIKKIPNDNLIESKWGKKGFQKWLNN